MNTIERIAFIAILMMALLTGQTRAQTAEGCRAEELFVNGDWTLATAKKYIANVTYRTFSWGHGNQIEHAGSDGRVYLWYPNNRVIHPGAVKLTTSTWHECPDKAMIHICFRYGANTYNPVTGHVGAGWECGSFNQWTKRVNEIVPGDPLGLAHMKVPPFSLDS